MDTQFIEPCCAEKQLPALLRAKNMVSFQTNGDVLFEHILKSVACLAGQTLEIRLMVPEVDILMLRTLAWFGRRGWLKQLRVLTGKEQEAEVRREIGDNVAEVECFQCDRIAESLLIVCGESATVAVQGNLLTEVTPAHRFYTAAIGDAESDVIKQYTSLISPLMRKKDVSLGNDNEKKSVRRNKKGYLKSK